MSWTDLHTAAFESAPEDTECLLLSTSLDANQPAENGFTPLLIAAQEGHDRVVGVLLKHGARVDAAAMDRATALMMAAQTGNATVIPLLLGAGAELNIRNKHGAVVGRGYL